VRFDTCVDRIEKAGDQFIVHTAERILQAQCVIVATGWSGPHIPDIPGIELAIGYEAMPTAGEAFAANEC
jgi:cation diffusion facilitator CzcD-associated flavoprotein CzcO